MKKLIAKLFEKFNIDYHSCGDGRHYFYPLDEHGDHVSGKGPYMIEFGSWGSFGFILYTDDEEEFGFTLGLLLFTLRFVIENGEFARKFREGMLENSLVGGPDGGPERKSYDSIAISVMFRRRYLDFKYFTSDHHWSHKEGWTNFNWFYLNAPRRWMAKLGQRLGLSPQ